MQMTFDEMLEAYSSYRQSSGFKRPFPKELDRFRKTIKKLFGDVRYITQEMIDCWFVQKHTETHPSYHARVYPAVSFLKYIISRSWCDIVIPNVPKSLPSIAKPHVFSKLELENFFRACDEQTASDYTLPKKLNELEMPVFFRLLLGTGMRPNEAKYLKTRDVDCVNGIIIIRESKGYRERILPIHRSLSILLERYDNVLSGLMPNRTMFFPAYGDKPHCRNWVAENFRRLWRKYNTANAVAYDFRHNFAIHHVNSWVNVDSDIHEKMVTLSKYMGHRTFVSTLYYYSLVPRLGEIIEEQSKDFESIIPNLSDYEEE